MKNNNLKIIGCGGHCKVVLDALMQAPHQYKLSLCDSNAALLGKKINEFIIDSTFDSLSDFNGFVHIAIGNNKIREQIVNLLHKDAELLTIIHPAAIISPSANIKSGSLITAGAILGPESEVGKACIINHAAVIDHEVKIGDYCHIAPNSTLGGNVKVGNQVLIGAGAVVLPNLTIGDGAIIGAGSVVTKSVKVNSIVMGIPAK